MDRTPLRSGLDLAAAQGCRRRVRRFAEWCRLAAKVPEPQQAGWNPRLWSPAATRQHPLTGTSQPMPALSLEQSFGAMAMRTRAKTTRPAARRNNTRRAKSARAARTGRRWSQRVTEQSDALDLQQGVFTLKDPRRIAASLKRSAERSKRRKADPYRSAMSMLTFYLNRAGKTLPPGQRKTLQRAKDELRQQFGRA